METIINPALGTLMALWGIIGASIGVSITSVNKPESLYQEILVYVMATLIAFPILMGKIVVELLKRKQ